MIRNLRVLTISISTLLSLSAFSAEPIKLQIRLNDSSAAGKKKMKIFIHNEKVSRTTYVDLSEGKSGEYSRELQTSSKDPKIVDAYRIGEGTGTPARYWSFNTSSISDHELRIDLKPGKVTREQIVRSNSGSVSNPKPVAANSVTSSNPESQEYLSAVALYDVGRFPEAQKKFETLSSSKDQKISSYSRYYLGVIHLKDDRVDLAEKSLNALSADLTAEPEIRRNSIELLRRSAQLRAGQPAGAAKSLEKRVGGSVLFDFFQYDSNVESLPSSLSPVTDQSGIGFGLQAAVWYAPVRTEKRDLTLMYGFGATYHPESEFVPYDLASHFITARYQQKSEMNGNPLRFNIVPGAAFIQGQVDGVRRVPARDEILNSWFLQNQVSYLKSADVLIDGRFNVKYDKSKIPVATELDRASGFGALAGGTYTRYLNANKSKSYGLGVNLEWLNATGTNYRQLKPSVYGTFNVELPYKLLSRSVLSSYYDTYYDNLANREDKQVKLETSVTRFITESLWVSQSFAINKNFSNVAIGDYFRFVATSSLGLSF